MISLGAGHRFYLYGTPTDMRKGFDGLSGIVLQSGRQLLDGTVFVFVNRRRDKIKLLVWDRSGLLLFYKRLEGGTIELPTIAPGQTSGPISWTTLMLMLEGISLQNIVKRKRFYPDSVNKF